MIIPTINLSVSITRYNRLSSCILFRMKISIQYHPPVITNNIPNLILLLSLLPPDRSLIPTLANR